MNSLSEDEFSDLTEAIDWSQRQLVTPRKERVEIIKQYVGSHYADGGTGKNVPVNFLKLATDIYVRQLAARAPRVLVTAKRIDLKSIAANLELAINEIPKEINLSDTLRRFVTEALFSMGILKIGLHTVGEVLGHDYGESFVDVVTLDDFFLDMAAKRFDQIQFCGNDYWPLYDDVMKSKSFDTMDDDQEIKPDEHTVLGEAGEERAEGVSANESAQEFKKRLLLRDVWLPKEKLLLTYAVTTKRLLRTIEWKGPKAGPYVILGFSTVPGNLLPLAPASTWRDLHELANALFRKLAKQADAQKTVQGFPGGDEEGVDAFKKARDGEGIKWGAGAPELLKAGGIDQSSLVFSLQVKELISYFGGNLDSLGGLSRQAETLGQDRLLSEAAGAQMRDMANKTVDAIREVFRSLAWYEWHDPVKRRTLEKKLPGTDLSILVDWNNKARKGKFNVFDLDIDVFSLQDNSPGLRLQKLGMLMQQYVLPLMPAITEQSGQLDAQEILRIAGKYADLPELADIVTFVESTEPSGAGGKPPMPANTTRTYEHVGKPGMTDQGKDRAIQTALAAGGAGIGTEGG